MSRPKDQKSEEKDDTGGFKDAIEREDRINTYWLEISMLAAELNKKPDCHVFTSYSGHIDGYSVRVTDKSLHEKWSRATYCGPRWVQDLDKGFQGTIDKLKEEIATR